MVILTTVFSSNNCLAWLKLHRAAWLLIKYNISKLDLSQYKVRQGKWCPCATPLNPKTERRFMLMSERRPDFPLSSRLETMSLKRLLSLTRPQWVNCGLTRPGLPWPAWCDSVMFVTVGGFGSVSAYLCVPDHKIKGEMSLDVKQSWSTLFIITNLSWWARSSPNHLQ